MAAFIKKYRYIIIAAAVMAALLTAAFFAGDGAKVQQSGLASSYVSEESPKSKVCAPHAESVPTLSPADLTGSTASASASPAEERTETAGSEAEAPQSADMQSAPVQDTSLRCTISVSCHTAVENIDLLPAEKAAVIPSDGWILPPCSAGFSEGESAFDVLNRVCRENKIHMEFTSTPLYNSKYIEGIGNLYDFDCGSCSGWMYSVNGVFQPFGCSQYILNSGDTVQFMFTCNNGADIGGGDAIG